MLPLPIIRTPAVKNTIAIAICCLSLSARGEPPDCGDSDAALDYWRPLRQQAASQALPADKLAVQLVDCLGSPDPELRDRIGYELLTYWLRQEQLTDTTRATLLELLQAQLNRRGDDAVLSRSFAALLLAELMRSDANKPFMSDSQRQRLLEAAAAALNAETDFRGLDETLGWVHPVAHMADLLWRFALHPATTADQGAFLLLAVREKVAPTEVAYVFNESDRLARVVSTAMRRGLIEPGVGNAWLESFGTPQSMAKWSSAFSSVEGMRELHNTKQFLRALSDQLAGIELDEATGRTLDELVSGFTQLI